MTEKKQLLWMRILLVVFVVVSVVIALDPPTFIAQLMGISWGALAGAFLAPFMYGLYWKGVTKASVWASFIFGAGIMILNMVAKSAFPAILQSPVNCGAVAMLGGLIIVPVVSWITPKPEKAMVEDAFSCYEQDVVVKSKKPLNG